LNEQIIALGGGGFCDGTDPELDVYILQQGRSARPNIGFIPTASGDSDHTLVKFYSRCAQLSCHPAHLPLFLRTPDLEQWLNAQDIIYVGGGNTRSMLAVWQAWGLPELLAAALSHGTVLAGVSAGAICWFEHGITDSSAATLASLPCLGLLPGSCCPHYSNEAERKPTFARLIEAGTIPAGLAIDDGAAVHFSCGVPQRVVVGRPAANAYHVRRGTDCVVVAPISGVETVSIL